MLPLHEWGGDSGGANDLGKPYLGVRSHFQVLTIRRNLISAKRAYFKRKV
jgi:hypothetical protein